MAGTAVLLPLSPDNDYKPEILICGGSSIDDTKPGYEISSQDPASPQCSRMVLTKEGIAAGWDVDEMPEARLMPDAVLLPTGDVVLVNGAGSGISGYGNVVDRSAHPTQTSRYDAGSVHAVGRTRRTLLSRRDADERDPRLYHSVATLTPGGDIMIAGMVGPPYMSKARPEIVSGPTKLEFGQTAELTVKLADGARMALMDFGYVTHAVHANFVWSTSLHLSLKMH
ncbi:hypothetical protein B0H10DRAFT_2212639 [Mycena sp. CBHHK59/15]|nr:hypothetical protein B0H10DRAFT_2212639 [Mycena sp. CBHHK59/15]